ncbi:MAG: hypothetical protein O7A67_02155 [SAR324 cluster bacterium]|nr:hypothetical protein [SAR324 cluster bacterium]
MKAKRTDRPTPTGRPRQRNKPGRPSRSPAQHPPNPTRLDGDPRILGPSEHPVRVEQIDPAVADAIRRLRAAGFLTLIVGGAVRDLLLGRTPKDFDIVTAARPEQIKPLFRHARIIGRRFRLVLLRIGGREVEVSTFRARSTGPRGPGPVRRDNRFGSPREDAFRRDFGVNALAFDLEAFSVVDYVGGLEDLEQRVIRTIAPPEASFMEDPVRMLRAVRFKVRLGFHLHQGLEPAIRRLVEHLRDATRHRLAEETQRFLGSGQAERTFAEFERLGLLRPLLGLEAHPRYFDPEAMERPHPVLLPYLRALDRWSAEMDEPVSPTVALLGLLLTLARGELKAYLLGELGAAGLDRTAGVDVRRQIPRMLSDWGLLNGQVDPALHILAAARSLLRSREKTRRPKAGARPGEREAWMLLSLLRDILGLDDDFLAPVREALRELRLLPILDHHQPWRMRGFGPIRPRHPTGETSPRPKRRRRRRSRRSGAKPAAEAVG